MIYEYDIIVVGGGIAGLWIGNRARRAGYNVIVIEKEKLGAGQTLASQGIIHGGQKYALRGVLTSQAAAVAKMPERWRAAIDGRGEVDLTSVRLLSDTQVMWPAGSLVSAAAVIAAANLVNANCRVLKQADFPEALRKCGKLRGPVYSLPERIVDVRSVVSALATNLEGRVHKGELTDINRDGEVVVSGRRLRARLIVSAAGTGNELVVGMLKLSQRLTQRRPLRQIMIRRLPYALFAHGIGDLGRPRISVTSHPVGQDHYVWYLGGAVAEKAAEFDSADALRFARGEVEQIFPEIDWSDKEWATWYGDRAEPLDIKRELPQGAFVHQCGRVLLAWPTKLTLAPAVSDQVIARLDGIDPAAQSLPPPLPPAEIGCYPWEMPAWQRLA